MGEDLMIHDHIQELRTRIIKIILAVIALSVVFYPFSDELVLMINKDLLGGYAQTLVFTTPIEAIPILIGIYVSIPFTIHELFKFTAPGLYPNEKKWFVVGLIGSIGLFTIGLLFTYLILLPLMLKFLISYSVSIARPMLIIGEFYSFVFLMMLCMGLFFQWPLIVGVLSRLGVVNQKLLSSNRHYAILICFVASAIITDPSFITQLILAVPMIILYEVGILVARIMEH